MKSILEMLGLPEKLITEPSYQKIIELKQELIRLEIQHYFNYDIHKWTWWLNLAVTIIPWIIWWKVVDRKRILEIALYGGIVLTFTTFLDVAGSTMGLWDYPDKILPFLPMLPFDFVVLPVAYMLIYQKYRLWKDFVIASTVLAAIYAFIAEPITVWLNLALFIKWKYMYSFPVYICIAISARWLVERIKARRI